MLHTPLPQTPLPSALGGLPHRRQQLQFTGIELATTEPAEASTTQAPTVPIPPEPLSATSAPTRVSPLLDTTSFNSLNHASPPTLAEAQNKKLKRTAGQYVFDAFLYPFLAYLGVFAFSVYVTYQTTYGAKGTFFKDRGDSFRQVAQEVLGLSKNNARELVMIFWSFIDGSLMAPVVKLFEDRRNDIAQKIDKKLGTEPDDPDAYKQEPKQTWGSVLGGRFVTSAIVVPTAGVLGKGGENSLNKTLFEKPGYAAGDWLEKSLPALKKVFPKLSIAGLCEIMAFEAFYTSVCTAGLYISSRLFATLAQKAQLKEGATIAKQASTPTPATVTTGLTPA